MIGTCALCLTETKLEKSHIISEFLYEPCYDVNHQFLSITASAEVRSEFSQVGYREPLLCKKCEGILGKIESSTAKLVRMLYKDRTPNNGVITVSKDKYSYKELKLFTLSILWRCCVYNLRKGKPNGAGIFGQVPLGEHAEIIRQMLLHNDEGSLKQYPIMLVKVFGNEENRAARLIIPPTRARIQKMNGYYFVAYGLEWLCVISKHFNVQSTWRFVGFGPDLFVPVIEREDQEISEIILSNIPQEQMVHTDAIAKRVRQQAEKKMASQSRKSKPE